MNILDGHPIGIRVWYFFGELGIRRLPMSPAEVLSSIEQVCEVVSVKVAEFSPAGRLSEDADAMTLVHFVEEAKAGNCEVVISADTYRKTAVHWKSMNEADMIFLCREPQLADMEIRVQALDSSVWRLEGPAGLADRIGIQFLVNSPDLMMKIDPRVN